ncbi:hypothetical protein O181_089269 [Austropuccinia psidii MF-1]|uniref:Uncharacterized protein n=1 Tax=Austropuccinia psidii MF-1 TaxID=1389203 RepID=A0A9Q3IT73_9BASI|nr:hypothetical protein [Austropuccinia psidii MF-1]
MGPMVVYGHFGAMVICLQIWLRWAHLALGASGLPPLAPFGLIGLGQKRPNWPMDHRGQDPPNEKGWPKDNEEGYGAQNPLGDRETPPRPKKKIEAWGLRIWELAREANDGRIWPEDINDGWGHNWPGKSDMAKGP